MKQLSALLLMSIFFSCNSESGTGEGDFTKMSFSLDTVMVDPGDDIINLKHGIWLSALSPDKKYLYNFDRDQSLIEIVSLDHLNLEEKIPFEKEGPNGTGQYLSRIQINRDNLFELSSREGTGIFTAQGQKIQEFKLRKEEIEGDQLKEGEDFSNFHISSDGNTLISLINSWNEKGYALGVLEYDSRKLKRHELEDFDRTQDYSVTFRSGNGMTISAQSVDLQEYLGKYLISNAIFNTIVLYDPEADSLTYIKYDNRLTENSKKGKYKNEVDSHEARVKESQLIKQEINFMAPVWDEQNEHFYRFSYKLKPAEENAEANTPAKAEVFLTVLDSGFQVLGESKVDALQKIPAKHFVKDGKIWMYENIDDELAFVRLSISR
jgi:hypothetical protein